VQGGSQVKKFWVNTHRDVADRAYNGGLGWSPQRAEQDPGAELLVRGEAF